MEKDTDIPSSCLARCVNGTGGKRTEASLPPRSFPSTGGSGRLALHDDERRQRASVSQRPAWLVLCRRGNLLSVLTSESRRTYRSGNVIVVVWWYTDRRIMYCNLSPCTENYLAMACHRRGAREPVGTNMPSYPLALATPKGISTLQHSLAQRAGLDSTQ